MPLSQAPIKLCAPRIQELSFHFGLKREEKTVSGTFVSLCFVAFVKTNSLTRRLKQKHRLYSVQRDFFPLIIPDQHRFPFGKEKRRFVLLSRQYIYIFFFQFTKLDFVVIWCRVSPGWSGPLGLPVVPRRHEPFLPGGFKPTSSAVVSGGETRRVPPRFPSRVPFPFFRLFLNADRVTPSTKQKHVHAVWDPVITPYVA